MSEEKPKRGITRRDLLFMLCLLVAAAIFRSEAVQAVTVISSSMEPTLHGGEDVDDDMVLLNKLAYKVSEPARWDVVVFRHPGSGENFIKRLVGLPLEKIRIKNGDIFINGKIAVKDTDIQDSLWLPVSPSDESSLEDIASDWKTRSGLGRVASDHAGFEAKCPTGVSLCGVDYKYKIVGGGLRDKTADLRVEFDAVVHDNVTVLSAEIYDNTIPYSFNLRLGETGKASLRVDREIVAHAENVKLAVGRIHHFEFTRVDGTLRLRVNGDTILERYESVELQTLHSTTASGVRIGIRSGSARFENLRIHRDIYYTSGSNNGRFATTAPFAVPQGEYFFLGDNSSNSKDSRSWGTVKKAGLIGRATFVINRFKSL